MKKLLSIIFVLSMTNVFCQIKLINYQDKVIKKFDLTEIEDYDFEKPLKIKFSKTFYSYFDVHGGNIKEIELYDEKGKVNLSVIPVELSFVREVKAVVKRKQDNSLNSYNGLTSVTFPCMGADGGSNDCRKKMDKIKGRLKQILKNLKIKHKIDE